MKKENTTNRRSFLKAGGAMLAAATLSATAQAQTDETEAANSNNDPQPIYLHGCAWNRGLSGIYGQACFTFDVRADVPTGIGLGTIRDDVHPQVNSQFQINSVQRRGKQYTLRGVIVASRSPELIGMRVNIVADSLDDNLGKASITIESENTELVVIAIIAILIGMLVPKIQRCTGGGPCPT